MTECISYIWKAYFTENEIQQNVEFFIIFFGSELNLTFYRRQFAILLSSINSTHYLSAIDDKAGSQ